MNAKTTATTVIRMHTVQTQLAPSLAAVILDFLEMEVRAQVPKIEKGVR